MSKSIIDELTTVEISGVWYLCKVNKDKLEFVQRERKGGDEATFRQWIIKHNLDQLQTIQIDHTSNFIIEPLDSKQKRLLSRLWEDMQVVKKEAMRRIENDYFMEDVT